jgi:hypothetical protein
MGYYGRVSEIVSRPSGTTIRCALDCRGAPVVRLKKAFDQIENVQLRQMQNAQLRAAGAILKTVVSADGWVDLVAVVTDPVAAKKISERTYTGCLVAFDDDVIADISVVDSPVGFMEKASRPTGGDVICKIYDGGEDLKDWKWSKQLAKRYGGTPAQHYAAELARKYRPSGSGPGEIAPAIASSAHAALYSWDSARVGLARQWH